MKRLCSFSLFLFAVAASAEPVTGTLKTPALKRTVQLVYIEKAEGKFPPAAQPIAINQKGNQFQPHIVPALVGSKVSFQSEDPELHNVFARNGTKVLFNRGQPPKSNFQQEFTQLGPVHLTCNIHREMSAWVVVLQNPYWAVPDATTGEFKIEGLPPGSYTLRVWGEKLESEMADKKFPLTVGGTQTPIQIAER